MKKRVKYKMVLFPIVYSISLSDVYVKRGMSWFMKFMRCFLGTEPIAISFHVSPKIKELAHQGRKL